MNKTTSLGTLIVYLAANATQYERALKSIDTSTANVMERVVNAAKYAAVGVVGALTAIGIAGVREFAQFDKAMTRSLAIMDNVTAEMRSDMAQVARDIAKTTTTSATEAAQAYKYLGSAGLSAAQAMKALPEVVKFAEASQVSAEQATALLTRSVASLGLASEDTVQYQKNLVRVMDVLSTAANVADGDATDYAVSLRTKVGGSLRLLNKDMEEGVAVLMAYGKQGILAENAGEQLAQVLRDLQRASIDNSQAWDFFGGKVFDASGKMLPLVDIVEQMEKILGPMSDEMKRVTLTTMGFQDRSVNAMMALLGTSKSIREYEKALRSASGATAKVANDQLKTFSSEMTILKHNVEDALLTLGDKLVPVLQVLNNAITGTSKEMGGLNTTVEDMTDLMKNGLVNVVGGAIDVFRGFAIIGLTAQRALNGIIGAGVYLGKVITVAWQAFEAFGEALGRGIFYILQKTIISVSTKIQEMRKFIIEASIASTEFLAKWLPGKAGEKAQETANKLASDLEDVKNNIKALATESEILEKVMTEGAVEYDKFVEAKEDLKKFHDEVAAGTDIYSQANKELGDLRDWIMDEGPSGAGFKKSVDELTDSVKKTREEAEKDFDMKNIEMKPRQLIKSAEEVSAAYRALEWGMREAMKDPLGDSLKEMSKYNVLLEKGIITMEEFDKVKRSITASQNPFISPLKGMGTMSGISEQDQVTQINNELLLLEDSYKKKKEMEEQYWRDMAASNTVNGQLTIEQEKLRLETMAEMQATYDAMRKEAEYARAHVILQAGQAGFDALTGVMKDAFGEQKGIYKAMFIASKAFAIADATLSIQQGIAQAAKAEPWWMKIPAMASVAAATAGLIGNITSVALSFEGGGSTGNAPRIGGLDGKGGFMAMLHPQERVVDDYMDEEIASRAPNVNVYQTFTGGVTESDLIRQTSIMKQETKRELADEISRGGATREAFQR